MGNSLKKIPKKYKNMSGEELGFCLWKSCFENRKEEVKKLILFGVDKEVNYFIF